MRCGITPPPPLKSWKTTAQFTEGTGYYPSRMGFPRPPSVKSQSVDDLLKEMKEADILGVIMGRQAPRPLGIIPNDEITEVMQQHPGRFVAFTGMLCTMVGNDLAYGSPTPVAKVAKDFPKLKIVISHGAWPSVMPMIEVAFMRENVYVSPDLYINGIDTPGSQEYIKAAKSFMPGRLLFGTAYPSRPLKESVDAFRQLNLRPELHNKILYRNAARLLKLE